MQTILPAAEGPRARQECPTLSPRWSTGCRGARWGPRRHVRRRRYSPTTARRSPRATSMNRRRLRRRLLCHHSGRYRARQGRYSPTVRQVARRHTKRTVGLKDPNLRGRHTVPGVDREFRGQPSRRRSRYFRIPRRHDLGAYRPVHPAPQDLTFRAGGGCGPRGGRLLPIRPRHCCLTRADTPGARSSPRTKSVGCSRTLRRNRLLICRIG